MLACCNGGQRCTVERIKFDPKGSSASAAGRRRRRRTFREPSLLRRTTTTGGGGVGASGHGATAETGPDQVTRLTVVLENPADAQLLVSEVVACCCSVSIFFFFINGESGVCLCSLFFVARFSWGQASRQAGGVRATYTGGRGSEVGEHRSVSSGPQWDCV